MMSKSLNYAYPQKFAEGGDVVPDTRQRLEFTPSASGGMVRYVLYDDKGREAQSGVTQRKNVESGLFGPGTNEKYNVSFLEQAPAPDTPVFSLPPGVDPMLPAPVTPPPVVNPVFTPSPDNTAFTPPPPPPVEGRTYGAYSGTPMGPTNSIQPFTPYMPPQQAQGPDLQSLITDTDYLLNNSGPRTSVFQRS